MPGSENALSASVPGDDVRAAIDFYTAHLGFTVRSAALPAFADITRGHLRLLLSGRPAQEHGRCA